MNGETLLPGRCPISNKVRHPDRAAARRAGRRNHPGVRFAEYNDCPACPGFWHFGHPMYHGRAPGEICGVSRDPAFRREAAVRAAHILAGRGHVVTRCGWHWHLVPVPVADEITAGRAA